MWGSGFLATAGVFDFAGGTVVHINSGVAGLVACLMLRQRVRFRRENMQPHNLVLSMIGPSLLWVGWMTIEWAVAKKPNVLGIVLQCRGRLARH